MANMNKVQIDEFIRLLQKYELSIATLYETFANILPSSRKAWMNYAREERLHAKWINVLHTHMNDDIISFEQTKITTQAIRISINYIESQIEKAIESKVDLKQALIIAIDIEKSLLESAFFKVFKLSGSKAEKVRSRLLAATEAHVKGLVEWQTSIGKA